MNYTKFDHFIIIYFVYKYYQAWEKKCLGMSLIITMAVGIINRLLLMKGETIIFQLKYAFGHIF